MSGPIIVATDFEARSDRAIDRAIALGKQCDRRVILFHGRDVPPYASAEDHRLDQKLRESLPAGESDVDFAYSIGHVPQAIAEYAEEQDAELIVMGVARRNSIGDFILGTVVDHVIRRSPRPVLVVKKRPQHDYRKVAVATDFSDYAKAALEWVADFLPDTGIHLLHSFHVPYPAWNKAAYVRNELQAHAREGMDGFVASLPEAVRNRITMHIENATLSVAMEKLVNDQSIDLVVLGSHGETGFRHATIGSQANALLTTTQTDTIILGPRVAE